jgi:hypothetical protein
MQSGYESADSNSEMRHMSQPAPGLEGTLNLFGSLTFLCRQAPLEKVYFGVNKPTRYKALTLGDSILIFMVTVGKSK